MYQSHHLIIFAFGLNLFFVVTVECTENYWSYFEQHIWKYVKDSDCGSKNLLWSPIDIRDTDMHSPSSFQLNQLQFSYLNLNTHGFWHNNGCTLKFVPTTKSKFGSHITNDYELKQFHIQWPHSEHAVSGYKYDAEIHFVHELPNTNKDNFNHYAVVSVLLCKSQRMSLSGTWKTLSQIPKYMSSFISAIA